MKYRKLAIVLSAFLLIGGMTACSGSNNDNTNTEQSDKAEDSEEKEEPEEETTELTIEEDTASELEEKDGVERAIVQLETIGEKQFVNAHISLEENSATDVDALVEEYKGILQEKYPDRTLDLIISKGDEILSQETFK